MTNGCEGPLNFGFVRVCKVSSGSYGLSEHTGFFVRSP